MKGEASWSTTKHILTNTDFLDFSIVWGELMCLFINFIIFLKLLKEYIAPLFPTLFLSILGFL